MDKVRKPSDSKCYTLSSESYNESLWGLVALVALLYCFDKTRTDAALI
jgi:hypothetical protein